MKLQHSLVTRTSNPAEFKTVGTQRINSESLSLEVMVEKSKPTSAPWILDRAPYIRDKIEWKTAFPAAYGIVFDLTFLIKALINHSIILLGQLL